jgi:hypothetical protein
MSKEIIYIEWCDAMSSTEAWTSESDAIEWAESNDWVNKQVGFVVKETDKFLLLAGEIGNIESSEPQLGQLIKIPTTWILKRETLK